MLEQILPGKALDTTSLYNPKVELVNGEYVQIGLTMPDGTYRHFENGEEFFVLRDGNNRYPMIRLKTGENVPLLIWQAKFINERNIPHLSNHHQELFRQILQQHPTLNRLEVYLGTPDDNQVLSKTGGYWQRPNSMYQNPSIVVNLLQDEHLRSLFTIREIAARQAAKLLDLSFEDLQRNPWILSLFIFAHEIGHVYHFLEHFVKDTIDPREYLAAITQNRDARSAEMANLPVLNHNPATLRSSLQNETTRSSILDQYNRTFQQNISEEELIRKQEAAYRDLPSEKFADTFAQQVVRKYLDALKKNL